MTSPADFPVYTVHPDRELYRVHHAKRGPLFFAAAKQPGQGGRFDLPADSGWGTCYLSTSRIGACVETFGRFQALTDGLVAVRRLTVVAPVINLRLADFTFRRVLGDFGITGDVSAGSEYEEPQRWALQLWEAGFDGIYYAARHDPQFVERSVALFARQGDRTEEERKRFECTTATIPDDLVAELAQDFGTRVLPAAELPDG